MQIVVIDTTPQLRASLLGRAQEAARQAGMQRVSIVEIDPLNLDDVNWSVTVGIFLGVGCGSMIKELLGKIHSAGCEAPVAIVLDAETYAGEAVAIHKILGRVVVSETDLTQMATFIVDCERVASGRPLGVRARCIVGLAQCKGGVGTTTMTAALGSCIARAGYTVALVDLDDVSAHLTEWGRVGTTQRILVSELLRAGEFNTERLRDLVTPIDGFDGRLVVVGQPFSYSEAFHLKSYVLEGAPTASVFINSLLSLLSTEYEVVLIDLGRSWGIATFATLPWCEKVALVIDDDGLSVRRSIDTLSRFKQESGDPEEFNLAKWSVVLNRWSGKRLTVPDVEDALNAAEIFPRRPRVFTVNFTEFGRQWGAPGQSLYEGSPAQVRQQIETLCEALIPSRDGRSFPRTKTSIGSTLGRLLGK
jgi:cellulose biosynthesis protein BcsQ